MAAARDVVDVPIDLTIKNIVKRSIGKHWKELARELGIDEYDVETLEKIHVKDGTKEMCHQALKIWTEQNSYKATISTLIDSLIAIRRIDLADAVKQQIDRNNPGADIKNVPAVDSEDSKSMVSNHKNKQAKLAQTSQPQVSNETDQLSTHRNEVEPETPQNDKAVKFKIDTNFKQTTQASKTYGQHEKTQLVLPCNSPAAILQTAAREPNSEKYLDYGHLSIDDQTSQSSDIQIVESIEKGKTNKHTAGVAVVKRGAKPKTNKTTKEKDQQCVHIQPAETITRRSRFGRRDSFSKWNQSPDYSMTDQNSWTWITDTYTQVGAKVEQIYQVIEPKNDADLMECHIGALLCHTLICIVCIPEIFINYDFAVEHLKDDNHKINVKDTPCLPEKWKMRLVKLASQRKDETRQAERLTKANVATEMFFTKECKICSTEFYNYQPMVDHLMSSTHKQNLANNDILT